jgi:hypothetical protein
MSRLGDPAPQPRGGAARFATPKPTEQEVKTPEISDVKALKRHDVPTLKTQKQPMTLRFTPETIERLADLERHLRRAGIKARQACASEIIEALVRTTNPETVQGLIRAEK